MAIKSISEHAFHQDLEWLFEVVAEQIGLIGRHLSSHNIEVPRIPKRLGEHVLPYALAANLRMLFDYAHGTRDISADFVRDTHDSVMTVLFCNAADLARKRRPTPDWELLRHRPIGVALLAAMARVKLADLQPLSFDELNSLTGISATRAERLGITTTARENGELEYDAKGVRAALARSGSDDA